MPDLPKLEGISLKQIQRGKDIETIIDKCILMLNGIKENVYRHSEIPILWEDLEEKVRQMIAKNKEGITGFKNEIAAINTANIALSNEINGLKESISSIKESLINLKTEINIIKSKLP